MTTPRGPIYAGYRYPPEIICYAVWLYFRFPLSLRMVEEMLAAREISVSHETARQWGLKFGEVFAHRVRQRAPQRGDKWPLGEVVITIAERKHWLWRAVDRQGFVLGALVLEVIVQSRRNAKAARRLLRKLLEKQGRAPRVTTPFKLGSYGAAKRNIMPGVEHRQHKGRKTGPQQPGREFPPANKATRAHHEGLQVTAPRPALPRHPRSNCQRLFSPAPNQRHRKPLCPHPGVHASG
jgi:putative transposase